MKERIVELLKTTENKRYVYMSDSEKKLEEVKNHAIANVDFTTATTKVVLIHPEAMVQIRFDVDGVFVDDGHAPEEAVRALIKLRENGFIEFVKETA